MIHTLRPLDLVRFGLVGHFQGKDWAETLDSLGRGAPKPLSSMMLLKEGMPVSPRRCALIWEDKGRFLGLASCRMRSGPSAWEVEHLLMDPEAKSLGIELLEKLSAAAAQRGAQKLFLRMPVDSPLNDELFRGGFLPLFRESLYLGSGEALRAGGRTHLPGLRQRHQKDELALFQLYTIVTPPRVRFLVAMTLGEWRDFQEKKRSLIPNMVLERDEKIKVWLRLWKRGSIGYIGLLSNPEEKEEGLLLDYAITRLKGCQGIFCLVSEFQEPLARQLQERGFRLAAEYNNMVKSVTIKEEEVQPAPARI